MNLNEFFTMLFGNSIDGFIEIRAIPSERGKIERKWYTNHDKLINDLLQGWGKLNGCRWKYNLYFGVCPRSRKGSKKEDVKQVRCLWVDLDLKNYTTDYGASNTTLNFHPPVDIMVKSGQGFHCYWLLKQPIEITSNEIRQRVEASIKGLHNKFGCRGEGTHDLSRILRVPGSLNWKYNPPMECEVWYARA